MKKKSILLFMCCVLALTVSAQWPLTENQKREIAELATETNIPPQFREQDMMIIYVNHKNLAYRAAVINKMLEEANYFADKLQLPTKRPVQIMDIQYPMIFPPWNGVVRDERTTPFQIVSVYGTNIFNASIPREARLRALKFGTAGTIETTNFKFGFMEGELTHVMRLSEHDVEYYARDLDKLVGKPSLIDTNGAYQLATQWLAAVNVDVAALEKASGHLIKGGHSIQQLQVLPIGAINPVPVPIYYVDFGSKHYPASGNLHAFDEPLVSVEVLGTTKKLQELTINDTSFSRRPLLLITNALDLIRTPNPSAKHLEHSPVVKTNSTSPP